MQIVCGEGPTDGQEIKRLSHLRQEPVDVADIERASQQHIARDLQQVGLKGSKWRPEQFHEQLTVGALCERAVDGQRSWRKTRADGAAVIEDVSDHGARSRQ